MRERPLQLGRGRDVSGEVPLELLDVAGDDLLGDLLVQPVLLVLDIRGQCLSVVGSVGGVVQALVREDVGDAVQRLLLAERQLERYHGRAEAGAELA